MAKGARATVLLLVVWLAVAGLARAQGSEELAGQAAEQAGRLREALTHYVAALRSAGEATTDAARLSQQIISIALKLKPPPAVPEEAERRMARGRVAIKTAQSPADFEGAAAEFLEARTQAPWWPDAYFNLGVAREKQGAYAMAIAAYQGYLLARPAADDGGAVKTKIYELEFMQEKAQKEDAARRQAQQAAAQQAAQQAAMIASLASGTWCERSRFNTYGDRCASGAITVPVNGPPWQVTIQMATINVSVSGNQLAIAIDWHNGSFYEEKGTLNGLAYQGTHTSRNPGARTYDNQPGTGTVSADGKVISIQSKEFGTSVTIELARIR